MDELDQLYDRLEAARQTMAGFPLDQTPLPTDQLCRFLRFVINNLGDPWHGGTYGLNTFDLERQVLGRLAGLYHLDELHTGYVTSCGSEGNLKGIAAGLERYPDAVVYASTKVHYSVDKACRLMRAPLVKVAVTGTHDLDMFDLQKQLDRKRPAVFVLTAGTTMAGAIDDVAMTWALAKASDVPCYIHVDAALFGLLTPFLERAPVYDFRLKIDSLSVSGHKMLGVPIPCGVFVARAGATAAPDVEYIGSHDSTIGGSRSGFAVLALWYALRHYRDVGLRRRAWRCLSVTRYAQTALRHHGWPCWSNDWSNIVVLGRPPQEFVKRWQLAATPTEAHLVCMPHVNEDFVDRFVSELCQTKPVEELVCAS